MRDNSKPKGQELGWQLLHTQRLYQSQWFNLRQDRLTLPNSEETTYTYVEHPGSVFVVPVTAQREFFLLRSYRYTIDNWCWEVPAGGLGDKSGLPLEEVARQELAEEIGGTSEKLEYLGWYYMANGFAELKNHFFVARSIILNQQCQREITEEMEIERVQLFPLEEVLQMVYSGAINDGESAFAVLLAIAQLAQG
jgi:ADP-ribose pyrophosphatase